MKKISYMYNGIEYASIDDLAKAADVSPVFLDVTLDGERSIEESIDDARDMGNMLDEICDDLAEEQERRNREFDMSLGIV